MATIKVGSARIDENGNATGGKAGDQKQTSSTNDTKGEVSMQSMYTHSKGWYILRPKSVTHAKKMASLMKKACNNEHIGYDQSGRLGIISKGISTTTDTECDCSSLVREVVKEATGTDPGNFTTANEVSKLTSTGLFKDKISYTSQSKTPVYNGDVLVTKTQGHTVIVVSGNARSSTTSTTTTATTTTANSSTTYKVETATSKVSGYSSGKTLTTTANLRLRTGAGTSKTIIKTMSKSTKVTWYGYYTKTSGVKWYLVKDSTGQTGFACSTYLK